MRERIKAVAEWLSTETKEQAAQRQGPTDDMLEVAALVYNRIDSYSPFSPGMQKQDLLHAHNGDFKATLFSYDENSLYIVAHRLSTLVDL